MHFVTMENFVPIWPNARGNHPRARTFLRAISMKNALRAFFFLPPLKYTVTMETSGAAAITVEIYLGLGFVRMLLRIALVAIVTSVRLRLSIISFKVKYNVLTGMNVGLVKFDTSFVTNTSSLWWS